MSVFKKAERKRVKLKIAITGPSGSGKTFSALELASGLGKKIALVDTENDSASLYSDRFTFDSLVIEPPYTIDKYRQAIQDAEKEGYEVLVIDSISHAWAGDGGLLSKKEAMDARGGNSYTNWGGITKEHEAFKSKLLNAGLHLICTMRSKQDYVLETNDKGKQTPRKVGLAPIQRDGMEYEFTTVFDVAMDHNAQASKDRTGLFDGQITKVTQKTGEKLIDWLSGATQDATISEFQRMSLFDDAESAGCPPEKAKEIVHGFGYPSSKEIKVTDLEKIRTALVGWNVQAVAAT